MGNKRFNHDFRFSLSKYRIRVSRKSYKNLRLVDGVEEAHALSGVYDLLLKIKAASIDKLKEIIKIRIRQIIGVTSTLTLMIVEPGK